MKILLTMLFVAGMCSAQYGQCFVTNENKNPVNRPMYLFKINPPFKTFCESNIIIKEKWPL